MQGHIHSCMDEVPCEGKSGPCLEELLMLFKAHILCFFMYKKMLA